MDSSDVVAGTNAQATEYNNLRKDVVLGKKIMGVDADAATVTVDLSDKTKSNVRTITLEGNRTLALSNPTIGQVFILRIVQDGTGSRVPTWWLTIIWPGGSAPTLTTTAGAVDVFGFICTAEDEYDGVFVGFNLS